ncbi:carbohydrate ABC transporter permease [bacterium]|nr:MAG: carbohydrate ABC transporter permease [bacterium]
MDRISPFGKAWRLLAMLCIAGLFLFPFFSVFSASLRPPGLPPPRTVEWIPSPTTWRNYGEIFRMLPFGRYLANSLFVTAVAIPLTLVTASMAGYATARLSPRPRLMIVYLAITLQIIPVTALWLPRFLIVKWLGLMDTYAALWLPVLMGSAPLYVLLYYRSCVSVPPSLYEAAELDGASTLKVWWRIAMPLARSTTMAVSALTFAMYWSDYINPLLYLKSQDRFTLPLGLQQLQQLDKTNWPLLMAASAVLILPAAIVFLLIQRFFLQESRLGGSSGW